MASCSLAATRSCRHLPPSVEAINDVGWLKAVVGPFAF
jgi:hypothetical protein